MNVIKKGKIKMDNGIESLPDLIKDCGRDFGQNLILNAVESGDANQKDMQLRMMIFAGVHMIAQHINNMELQNNVSIGRAILSIKETIENEVDFLSSHSEKPEFLNFEDDND